MNDRYTISRRALVRSGLGAIAAPAVLRVLPAEAQSQVIKIGHVSPKTGPLAGFGEADGFILDQVRAILAKGLENGGKTYKVEIISKDSQSSGNRAAEVASELILGDKVNLIVASATPDTTNPVSDQAEVNEVPCITTNCPWQPYFFGRIERIAFEAVMIPERSWWNPAMPPAATAYVLQHEQIHFALTELAARRLTRDSAAWAAAQLVIRPSPQEVQAEMARLVRERVNTAMEEGLKRHAEFDEDASLFYNPRRQRWWAWTVEDELQATEAAALQTAPAAP